ncbi:kinase domain protein [Dictyocaulus viviparus]|uniref:Kinase domain protein n=1 Tax=Dictyocaulus viviparus TaxID=29172 RepID=A0A0D8XEP5_DICVI|nr:kinase domain protein [Dictyocaulus viviparus]
MQTDGKIKVDENYPTEVDEPPLINAKKIESIRSDVKFDQCYECSKQLGDGKFGKVYQVREKSSGQEFAAKVIRIKKQADRQEVEREVSILTQLRHPRIAQIYDAFYTSNNEIVLVMEIVRGGELFDRVADENYVLTELAVVMIICQLCEAIDYIHEQNILHLDIKIKKQKHAEIQPENIMCVSQSGNRIKLIDFGLAQHYDGTQELRYMAGTPEFAAPEVIKYEQLDYHTDMWSVGVITYILLSGYSPFLGENIAETYCNVEKGVWEFTEEFDSVSKEAKDFISHLIVYKKEERMLPKQCLAHPWIAKHRANASNDANLEKPAGGPKMDNRQMLRYNAKRKLRRMFIYVKFLIELNRLRAVMKDRMSQNGKRYFDTLLKMAEEKEKQVMPGNLTEKIKTAKTDQIEEALTKSNKKCDIIVNTSGATTQNFFRSELKSDNSRSPVGKTSSIPEPITTVPPKKDTLCEITDKTTTVASTANKRTLIAQDKSKKSAFNLTSEVVEKKTRLVASLATMTENTKSESSGNENLLVNDLNITKPPQPTSAVKSKTTVKKKTSALASQCSSSSNTNLLKDVNEIAYNVPYNLSTEKFSSVEALSNERELLGVRKSSDLQAVTVTIKNTALDGQKITIDGVKKCPSTQAKPIGRLDGEDNTKENRDIGEKALRQSVQRKKERLTNIAYASKHVAEVSDTQPNAFISSTLSKKANSKKMDHAAQQQDIASHKLGSAVKEKLIKFNSCAAPLPVSGPTYKLFSNEHHGRKPLEQDSKIDRELPTMNERETDKSISLSSLTTVGSVISVDKSSTPLEPRSNVGHVPCKLGSVVREKLSKLNDAASRPTLNVPSVLNPHQKPTDFVHKKADEAEKSKESSVTVANELKTTLTRTKKQNTNVVETVEKIKKISAPGNVMVVATSVAKQDTSFHKRTTDEAESRGVLDSGTLLTKKIGNELHEHMNEKQRRTARNNLRTKQDDV